MLLAALPAILIHEAGHLLLLRLYGTRLRSIKIGIAGVEMDYYGVLERFPTLMTAAAGPAFGVLYAWFAGRIGGAYFQRSGAMSLLLSLFNLLPVLPLDGGRLISELTEERTAEMVSAVCSVGMVLAGGYLAAVRHTVALLLMGAWLLLRNFRQ